MAENGNLKSGAPNRLSSKPSKNIFEKNRCPPSLPANWRQTGSGRSSCSSGAPVRLIAWDLCVEDDTSKGRAVAAFVQAIPCSLRVADIGEDRGWIFRPPNPPGEIFPGPSSAL